MKIIQIKNGETAINILGAGLAGLSAALSLARRGVPCRLISNAPSERAQSVLAEGGINAALDHYGEEDRTEEHLADTLRGGCFLADEEGVRGLTEKAPSIIAGLLSLGVPFNTEADGRVAQRYFGGQKKRRTAYVGSFTGKMLMSALTDAVRGYEQAGLVERFDHHAFVRLLLTDDGDGTGEQRRGGERNEDGAQRKHCRGLIVRDLFTDETLSIHGSVILASGGMTGMFPGHTTGSAYNTADVTATVFAQGVRLSNPEMIQYHPTTVAIPGKRMLITEAARGEGGRLFVFRKDGSRWYFMEEKYPALKNLMPRDVVSREIFYVLHDENCGDQVYLDMTALSGEVWETRLAELREEILSYLSMDPMKEPVPVTPGIHYFMGGIDVDRVHRTNIGRLYAAGECCSFYHGANRLGGNSTLAAIYGGQVAAETAALEAAETAVQRTAGEGAGTGGQPKGHAAADGMPDGVPSEQSPGSMTDASGRTSDQQAAWRPAAPAFCKKLGDILYEGLGIVRDEATLLDTMDKVIALEREAASETERHHILLAKAILAGALARKESRGAHFRSDYPESDDAYKKRTVVMADGADAAVQMMSFLKNSR